MAGLKRQKEQIAAGSLTNDPVVEEAIVRFNRSQEFYSIANKRFLDDLKFRHGDSENGYQWPGAVKNLRDADNRPCLTMNVVRQHNLMISNDARKNKSTVKFVGMGNGATAESASALRDLWRHVESRSKAQDSYTLARNFQIDGGIGWVRLVTDYESNDTFDQALYVVPVLDPLLVFPDPDHQKPDYSDMNWLVNIDWCPADQFEAAYPSFDGQTGIAPLGSGTVMNAWDQDGHVAVAEYFRRVKKKDKLVSFMHRGERKTIRHSKLHPDMHEIMKFPSTRVREVEDLQVEWYLIVGQQIVDSTEWLGSFIPFAPATGEEVMLDGIFDRKGHTRAMKDAQRMYNYNASGQVEFGALQSKTPYLAPAKAIEQYEDLWNTANKVNYSILPYNHVDEAGNPIPPPQRQEPPKSSPLFQEGMETAGNQMMMTSGQWQNQMGMMGNERTGAAIGKRLEQANTATAHFQDNYERMLVNLGTQFLDLVPKLYDTKRVHRVLADDGADYELVLDPSAREPFYEELSHENAVIRRILNPAVGVYEVSPSVGPEYNSKREQTVEALTLILTQNPGLTGIVGDLLLGAMDFDKAQEAARRLKRMIPPQALGKGPSQSEQALQQQLLEVQHLLAKALEKNAIDRVKLVGKAEMRDIDAYKAETDRIKALQSQVPLDAESLKALVEELMQDAAETSLTPILKANEEQVGEGANSMDETPPTPEPHPALGAQKAPDGQWYVRDPTRKGKYLQMAPLIQLHTGGPRG